jgi:hypothetical protein
MTLLAPLALIAAMQAAPSNKAVLLCTANARADAMIGQTVTGEVLIADTGVHGYNFESRDCALSWAVEFTDAVPTSTMSELMRIFGAPHISGERGPRVLEADITARLLRNAAGRPTFRLVSLTNIRIAIDGACVLSGDDPELRKAFCTPRATPSKKR